MKSKILLLVSLISNAFFAQNFHDTQGKLEISNSGQTTYTLPIAMPPSIKDVGPIINLVYVSGQNGGIAGQGWNINSISYISRMSTRLDIEGYRDGVDFDSDDKLALDGQRLLLKSGNYWADGSTYETEVRSNTKIELIGSGATMYFIVTSPDGSRSWYGNYGGTDGTELTAYYITRFEDANGNFMTYHYSKPFNKSLCINEIRFSANVTTNPTPLNKIVFTYKLANRKENAYIKGIRIEKVELLDKIEVFTNSLLFKKYQLTHVTDALGYERISQLQEFNGALEAANPVLFEYKTTPDSVTENATAYTDILNLSTSPDMSGDFDGDGRLDFISGNKLYTKLFQGETSNNVINLPFLKPDLTITTTENNKLIQAQSLVKINKLSPTLTEFKVYGLIGNTVQNLYTKTINLNLTISQTVNNTTGTTYGIQCLNYLNTTQTGWINSPIVGYKEGDFDGNGISEVLISKPSTDYTITNGPVYNTNNTPFDPNLCNFSITSGPPTYFLLDMDPNNSIELGTNGYKSIYDSYYCLNNITQIADFNSDGKSDILSIRPDGTYRICELVLTKNYGYTTLLGQGIIEGYSTTKQILFGDFNGDGKPDISLPTADRNGCEGCSNWEIYYSNPNPTGGIFFVKETYNIVEYRPSTGGDYETQWHNSSYYAMDVNKDGKSDIVRVWTSLWQYSPFWDPRDIDSSWTVNTYINNIGLNGGFSYNYGSPSYHDNDDNSRPIPLVSNYKYKGLDSDLLMIRFHGNNSFDKSVTYIDFKKDFSEDNLLQKVTQSNGSIIDEIKYDAMVPTAENNGFGSLDGFYSSTESLEYPLIELKQMANNKLVKQLKNTSLGVEKIQDFQYHGLAINLNGIGIIGFNKTARSVWHKDTSDKITWNVTENDATKRGSQVKTFSLLLNGNEKINFGSNYSNLLTKSENSFTETVNAQSKRYSILLNTQTSTDYLTNIVNQKIYNSYSSDFLLPTSVTNNKLLGTVLHGSSTTVTTYNNNPTGAGNTYYIGRPNEENTTNTVYVNTPTGSPDSKTNNNNYFYTNANLTQTEKKANGSAETLVESYVYLSNGLLQSKTISVTGTTAANAVSSRSTSYTYDATNRFIKTATDIEGLVTTNLTYHPLYGMVLTQQNPFSQVTTSTYDNWGKKTKVTDFLGKSINFTYTRVGNTYKTLQVGDDGSSSMVESDALARPIRKGAIDLNGNWVYSNTEYDFFGRKRKESDPYLATAAPTLWTLYEYDDYNRPIKTTSPTGKMVNTTYNGLTIAAADTVMTKTKTMNANGQVIIATDAPGGTITYTFDANNNLVESDYEGVKIAIQYDNWGRKTQLVDSSAGTYTTSYNAFGEIKTETTPKGTTTYNLDPFGKVLSKAVIGDGTSITSTYTYDASNKWLTNLAVVNPNDGNSNYAYTYDTKTKQLNKSIENLYPVGSTTAFATFTKQLTFDAFGRVLNETSTAKSHGKTSAKTIKHTYKNGVEWQILDGTIVKLQTNTVNSRGQVTSATLGNGIAVSNSFDDFGYNTQNKHELGTTNVMTLNNIFEPILANLTTRTNSMFDVKENFIYDSQDRLINWEGAGQNVINLPFNTTTEGFTFEGADLTGSVTNATGTLKVTLKTSVVSANKVLTVNAATGDKFRVKADITNKAGTTRVMVNAVMVETDPLDAYNFVEIPIGPINNGLFDFTYTTTDFVSNPNLTLKFTIDENSPLPLNGGGEIPASTLFNVDNLTIDKVTITTQNYDNRGRITENALGQYNYTKNGKPYQNSSVITTPEASNYYATKPLQSISYNAFKAPIQIEEKGIDKISFGYNAMLQRSVMYYGSTDNDKLKRPFRKYYSADGSMEIKATFVSGNTITPASVELITYIDGDAYSAAALIKSDGTTQNYFYLHRDYQGSIMAITNATGAVVEKRLYNPWGEIVKVQDGAGNNLSKLTFFDRGYTGHQHLESVGLINMNARLYDPKLHRFLSPDNFVQDPYNTQSFNRYGYCWNNPLKFTDKSGELIDVIIIGASIALAAYLTMNLVSGQPITLKGALMATFVGAVSGAVTFGIGSWTANTISNFALKATAQALYHGVFQGTLSGIQGGGFWAGAAAGALSSMASSLYAGGGPGKWQGLGGKFAQSTEGLIAFGTIAGGAGAALTGGNFWQGAVTGLIVSGLNHAMHPSDSYKDGEDDPPGKKSKTQVRKETVKPSAAKLFEVGGNTLSTSELFVDSPMAKFVRNGAPKSGSISKVLKVGGRTLGGIGIGFEAAEVYNGNMSYTEFGIDTGMALVGMTGWGAPVALVYFGGKAIYEYSSGNTLFTKPK